MLLAGSCFTEHIGERLERYLYAPFVNPFGILFDPESLARAFRRIAGKKMYSHQELIAHDGLYHSLDHHGVFSGRDADDVVSRINGSIVEAHDHLATSRAVFVSPGTSLVYRYRPTNVRVANCHKIPQDRFERQRLSVDECLDALRSTCQSIRHVNPQALICLTLSPVRHLRDGLHASQLSKATLLVAIDALQAEDPSIRYFPAYEIQHDELRDYRFYDRDMAHPSTLATDIIWSRFTGTCLDERDKAFHGSIEKLQQARMHRFLHPDREAIRSFANGQLRTIDRLARQLPQIDWQSLRLHFFRLTEPD